jgi:hypothetical protein
MRGAICAIFIVILSKNYNSNALSQTWFRGKTPSSPYLFFGAFHAIWRRPGQIAVAADDETGLYFGIAPRRHSADVSLGAPNAAFGGKADITRTCRHVRQYQVEADSRFPQDQLSRTRRVFNIEHSVSEADLERRRHVARWMCRAKSTKYWRFL